LKNPKFHFETDGCGMVSAPTSDVSPVQTAHKTQQLMRSTVKAVSGRLCCVTKWTNYLYPLNKTSDCSKYEYVEFKLKHPPFS